MEQTNWVSNIHPWPLLTAVGAPPHVPRGPPAALTQARLEKVHLTPSHGRRVTCHSAPASYRSSHPDVNSAHLRCTRFNIQDGLQKRDSDPGNVRSNGGRNKDCHCERGAPTGLPAVSKRVMPSARQPARGVTPDPGARPCPLPHFLLPPIPSSAWNRSGLGRGAGRGQFKVMYTSPDPPPGQALLCPVGCSDPLPLGGAESLSLPPLQQE